MSLYKKRLAIPFSSNTRSSPSTKKKIQTPTVWEHKRAQILCWAEELLFCSVVFFWSILLVADRWKNWGLSHHSPPWHYSPPLWYNYHDWGAIGYMPTKLGGGGGAIIELYLTQFLKTSWKIILSHICLCSTAIFIFPGFRLFSVALFWRLCSLFSRLKLTCRTNIGQLLVNLTLCEHPVSQRQVIEFSICDVWEPHLTSRLSRFIDNHVFNLNTIILTQLITSHLRLYGFIWTHRFGSPIVIDITYKSCRTCMLKLCNFCDKLNQRVYYSLKIRVFWHTCYFVYKR